MKKISIIFTLICSATSAQAFQVHDLKLNNVPPLKPLNTCKSANGTTRDQIEPCGPGETAITGYVEVGGSDNASKPLPNNEVQITSSESKTEAKNEPGTGNQSDQKANFWKRLGKLLGFAFVAGIVATFFKRSFFLGFILGLVLRLSLVALNIMQF
ncbi:hypothetical protein ACO0LG_22765 [Undibacterium sp. Ji42W]|uniref:hypothetical protein n=1 Tax=Undibacterium sp. Ji42W TaxID=3413039 RepID=UPI003BF2DC63